MQDHINSRGGGPIKVAKSEGFVKHFSLPWGGAKRFGSPQESVNQFSCRA